MAPVSPPPAQLGQRHKATTQSRSGGWRGGYGAWARMNHAEAGLGSGTELEAGEAAQWGPGTARVRAHARSSLPPPARTPRLFPISLAAYALCANCFLTTPCSPPPQTFPSLRASLLLVYLQPSSGAPPPGLSRPLPPPLSLSALCPSPSSWGSRPARPLPSLPRAWSQLPGGQPSPSWSSCVALVLGPSPGKGGGVPLCCRSSGPMAPQCLTLSHFCCSSVHVTPPFTSWQPHTVTYLTGRPGLRVGSPRLSGSEPSLPCCPPSLPCFPLFGHSCNGQASLPSTHTQCCPQRSLRCPLTQTPMCPGGWWPEAQAPARPPAGLWVAPSALQVGFPAG